MESVGDNPSRVSTQPRVKLIPGILVIYVGELSGIII